MEEQSQDYGRYGREPKAVPPKPLLGTETKQSKEEILKEERKKIVGKKRIKDPVCGKLVDPTTAEFHLRSEEEVDYFFCSKACLREFKESL